MVDMGTLIVAHLLGDYVFQTDWMAQGKTKSSIPCLVHATVYTLVFAVLTSFSWPLWAYIAIGAPHFVIDRWRLAGWYMDKFGLKGFKDNLGPWSLFIVDNTFHLLNALIVLRIVG